MSTHAFSGGKGPDAEQSPHPPAQAQTEATAPPSPGAAEPEAASRPRKMRHEAELFPQEPEPRYFGTGGYLTGGSVAEGNYAPPEPNLGADYDSFDDAGPLGGAPLPANETPEAGVPAASGPSADAPEPPVSSAAGGGSAKP